MSVIRKSSTLLPLLRSTGTKGAWSVFAQQPLQQQKQQHHQQQHYALFSSMTPRYRRRRFAPKMPKKIRANAPKGVPSCYQDMDELSLVTLGGSGNYEARQEILKRHIQATDKGSYEDACAVFSKIEEKNYEWMNMTALPFQISIVTAFTAGLAAIPLVFHLPTVEYFNEHFVTAEHPPLKELETSLEVGRYDAIKNSIDYDWQIFICCIFFILRISRLFRNLLSTLNFSWAWNW